MSEPVKFPSGFLWGTSTAAHQVEGNNKNDWTEWEMTNASRLAEEARLRHEKNPAWAFKEALKPENYVSAKACDHYNRFREDFDIAKSLGHNAHRLSIEWSRIEPEEGRFNQNAIDHYRKVLLALRERGIEPFVTLWHFTNPIWFAKQGGWENTKCAEKFVRYASVAADAFKDLATFWITINEPTVYAGASYASAQWPPQNKSLIKTYRVVRNLISAHKAAYKILHEKTGGAAQVGIAHNLHYDRPYAHWSLADRAAAALIAFVRDRWQMEAAAATEDFIGVNYYFRDIIRFVYHGGRFGAADVQNPNEIVSDMGWDLCPEGLYHVLMQAAKFKKPIYITENGIADAKDEKREWFIKKHLENVHKAICDGADVRGYFYWSLLDNFEWDKGFWPRFGLLEMNYGTLERKIRPSAKFYAEIANTNSIRA
jgi:beta-glucosidase